MAGTRGRIGNYTLLRGDLAKMKACSAIIAILFCGLFCSAGESAPAPLTLKRLDSITVRDFQVCGVSTPAFACLLQHKLKEWNADGRTSGVVWWLDGNILFIGDAPAKK